MEDLSGHDGQILHRPMILTLTRGVGGLDGINRAMGMHGTGKVRGCRVREGHLGIGEKYFNTR